MSSNYIFALGFFDGVHLGHQALLAACRRLAEGSGAKAGAVTFDTHPQALTRGDAPGLINRLADRLRLLEGCGMEQVVCLGFDDRLRQLPWEDFLEILRREHHAAGFVCGEDYRFGHRGQGSAHLLADYCRRKGLPFAAVPQQSLEGIRVSSTCIRGFLEQGDLERASRFLGHRHILSGSVIPGKQLGRRLGIPTANLALPKELAVPRLGVYACRCQVEGAVYAAVTNVGVRPTVSGEGITVESWLLDYSGSLYGRELTLEFAAFLRPEEKFPTLEALQSAVRADAQRAKELLSRDDN